MAPVAAIGSIIGICVLTLFFWNQSVWPLMVTWSYSSVILSYFMLKRRKRYMEGEMDQAALTSRLRHTTALAGTIGMIWGMIVAVLMMRDNVQNAAFAGALAVGMISAGAYLLAMTPWAAISFISTVVTGFAIGALFSRQSEYVPFIPLLVAYGAVMQRFVGWTAANFAKQRLIQQELQESSEVIGLLLHDFETHASDWLWETNSDGQLNRVSLRFAQAVRRPQEALEGEPFLEFFEGEQAEILKDFMLEPRSFREVVVPLTVGGEQRWWSVSGQPKRNGLGEIAGFRGVCSDVTKAREAESKIAHLAHFDVLTGLPNRATFAAELELAFDQLNSGGKGFALHCLDLDKFKTINDTLGHPAGDALLKTVASRLLEVINENDMASRLGGDEFVVLQRNVDNRSDAQLFADFLVDALLEPVLLEGQMTMVSGSVGTAVALEHGTTAKDLMKHADLALYAAKKDGRGCNRFFEAYMDEESRRRIQMEADLRKALNENELELHFQPLIDVKSMRVKGYESLLRWRRGENDVVLPTDFIEIAEETGLIIPLGEWVIRSAIAEAAQWPEQMTVAINLSPIQMTNPALISTIVNALASNRMDPSRVEFEITETVLLEETEANLKTLHAIRGLGAKIALDDFGTGFSSLNYLRAFPFDKIKIDKCFITDMETREDCRAIVAAVLDLANALNMRTTAEGIEHKAQVETLTEMGCAEIQGFLFSEPIPGRDLPKRNDKVDEPDDFADEPVILADRFARLA